MQRSSRTPFLLLAVKSSTLCLLVHFISFYLLSVWHKKKTAENTKVLFFVFWSDLRLPLLRSFFFFLHSHFLCLLFFFFPTCDSLFFFFFFPLFNGTLLFGSLNSLIFYPFLFYFSLAVFVEVNDSEKKKKERICFSICCCWFNDMSPFAPVLFFFFFFFLLIAFELLFFWNKQTNTKKSALFSFFFLTWLFWLEKFRLHSKLSHNEAGRRWAGEERTQRISRFFFSQFWKS